MNLLIDIGNTAVKIASELNGKITFLTKFFYKAEKDISPWNNLHTKLKLSLDSQIEHIYISNVAGTEMAENICQWCVRYFNISPQFAITQRKQHGLKNAYITPESLGIDRWLAMLAACDCLDGTILIVDCGTAVTIDAVNSKREFIGGLILPGLGLMRHSLTTGTDSIDLDHAVEYQEYFATNTKMGVIAGTAYSIASLIEKMVMILSHDSNSVVDCVLTGGDAHTIKSYLSIPVHVDQNLVLKGLSLYFRQDEWTGH